MKRGPWILAVACCAALAAGCFNVIEPTSPRSAGQTASSGVTASLGDRGAVDLAGPDAGAFYPLELGNHWLYSDHDLVQFIPNTGPPEAPYEELGSIAVEMTCVETVADRQYSVERSTYSFPSGTTDSWVRYRQDRSGLYELDFPTFDPPPCAGGSVTASRPAGVAAMTLIDCATAARPAYRLYRSALAQLERKRAALDQILRGRSLLNTQQALEGELTRLLYPLRAGEQWTIRADPQFTATVEGADVLDLPAGRFRGYRVRIEAPGLFGSNDRVVTWYDRHGALQLVAHLEGQLTDADGNVVGKAITDETRKLEELTLVEPGRF